MICIKRGGGKRRRITFFGQIKANYWRGSLLVGTSCRRYKNLFMHKPYHPTSLSLLSVKHVSMR